MHSLLIVLNISKNFLLHPQFCNCIQNHLSAQLILNYPYPNLGTYTTSEKIMEKKMEEEVNVKRALVTDCAEH